MCYPEKCGECGRTTWAGCGKHVPSVYEKVPNKDQICLCKPWPGVQLPATTKARESAKEPPAASDSSIPAAPAAKS